MPDGYVALTARVGGRAYLSTLFARAHVSRADDAELPAGRTGSGASVGLCFRGARIQLVAHAVDRLRVAQDRLEHAHEDVLVLGRIRARRHGAVEPLVG